MHLLGLKNIFLKFFKKTLDKYLTRWYYNMRNGEGVMNSLEFVTPFFVIYKERT